MMRRAFIVGGYVPNGGTFMAYQVGRILHLEFGYDVIIVRIGNETHLNAIHVYSPQFPCVSVAAMEKEIRADDVLICNPSFSGHRFGLRIAGKKISYVQGINTYSVLDRFDHYVAVSEVVARYLRLVYGLSATIIPPFIDLHRFPVPPPWESRPEGSIMTVVKGDAALKKALLGRLTAILAQKAPQVRLGTVISDVSLPQAHFLALIGAHRYLLALSPVEGFGLVPLEAMAMGTTVVGLDGAGGREYMDSGVNCAVATYPDLDAVADKLVAVMESRPLSAKLSAAGMATASQYTYARFRTAWVDEFERFLGHRAGGPPQSA